MKTQQFDIDIALIEVDETQPRKNFEQTKLDELAASIKTIGMIQPITVRQLSGKKQGKFSIVVGERRYRASLLAGCKTIPALIKDLTDEEVKIFQITENLQRADVHPMEEAKVMLTLLDIVKDRSIKDVCDIVCKNEFYVRQRLRLNELTEKWQTVFLKNKMTLKLAVKIASYNENVQKQIYKDNEESIKDGDDIDMDDWYFDNVSGDLSEAIFDKTDATIDSKVGACVGCKFNSASSLLFPEEKNSVCSNLACFTNKTNVTYQRNLKIALEDPLVVFVYGSNKNSKSIEEIKKEKRELYVTYSDFSFEREPKQPVISEYDITDYKSKKQMQDDFEKDIVKYEKEIKQFNQKVKSGAYKKSFYLDDGNNNNKTGKFFYISLYDKSKQNSGTKPKKLQDTKDATAQDLAEEISRLKANEIRAKELDLEKTKAAIVALVKDDIKLIHSPKVLPYDIVLQRYFFYEKAPWHAREKFYKSNDKDNSKLFEFLSKSKDVDWNNFVREVIYADGATSLPTYKSGYALLKMVEAVGVPVKDIYDKQAEIAKVRNEKVTARIKELTVLLNPKKEEKTSKEKSTK